MKKLISFFCVLACLLTVGCAENSNKKTATTEPVSVTLAKTCDVDSVYTIKGCLRKGTCSAGYGYSDVLARCIPGLSDTTYLSEYQRAYVANYGWLDRGSCAWGSVYNPSTATCVTIQDYSTLYFANATYNNLYRNWIASSGCYYYGYYLYCL